MADVDTYTYTTTKVRKTKKTSSSSAKRRESSDNGTDVQITEISEKENHLPLTNGISRKQRYLLVGERINCIAWHLGRVLGRLNIKQ